MNNFKELLNIPEYWKQERFLSLQNFDNEIWKDIDGYEGLYQISNFGRVKSFIFHNGNSERILKLGINHYGYLQIKLCKEGNPKSYRINRSVALGYIPNHLNKKTVNHIDTNKLNNMFDNLEWNTHGENIKHAYDNGLRERTRTFSRLNGINFSSKKIYCIELDREFYSLREAGRQLKISESTISKCCNGKRKSAGKLMILKLN